jgi:hypothetical protein
MQTCELRPGRYITLEPHLLFDDRLIAPAPWAPSSANDKIEGALLNEIGVFKEDIDLQVV